MTSGYPDYSKVVNPGVTRWAPGTEFGNITSAGAVSANSFATIYYEIPDNGYFYILDKSFIWTDIVGLVTASISFAMNYPAPTWIVIADKVQEGSMEILPYTFVSIALTHPAGLRWMVYNPNDVARNVSLYATMYRYKSTV